MKSLREFVIAIVVLASAIARVDGQPNHLVPIEREDRESAEYRWLIYKHLLVTSGQFGRMIYESGFSDPEWAVSVWQTERKIGPSEAGCYRLTVTRSLSSIWNSLPSKGADHMQQPIQISRKDTTIHRELAVAVQRAWKTMLSRTRSDRNKYLSSPDQPTVEFSLDTERGQVTPPHRGLTGEMFEIGRSLAKLCDIPPARYVAKRDELLRRLAAFERKAQDA